MIVFDLACTCGCQFEGWFHGHEDYEDQHAGGMLSCPACSGSDIHKILSPVASVRHTASKNTIPVASDSKTETEQQLTRAFVETLCNYVRNHFEDVGCRLAETSLKMRYGLEEPRSIRGVASEQEEKLLAKEGIELIKIPLPLEKESPEEN